MAFFGFFRAASEPSVYNDAIAYGNGLQSRAAPARHAAGASHACWAPQVASAHKVSIAIQGAPVLAGDKSTSVAERILVEYQRRGAAVFASLEGAFAVAIVDEGERRVLLAVDRMGIERLTYSHRSGSIVFSTSAKAVALCPGVAAGVRPQALYDYLLLHVVPAPDTTFSDVHKLRPGTYARFERDSLHTERYWQPDFAGNSGAKFESLARELHESLRDAVAAAQPDEFTGAFLSGGLDSSTVAGMLSGASKDPARTFTIGFGYPEYDELPYARIASAHFRCKAHEYVIQGSDIVTTFPQIARAYDEPFGNASALPVYYCAKLAREHGVTHLLAGDGGDELFAGNSRYLEQRVFERYALLPRFIRSALLEPLLGAWPASLEFTPIRKARSYVAKARVPLPERLESWNVVYQSGATAFLHPDVLPAIDTRAPFRRMQDVWNATPSRSSLDHMLYFDWQYTLADNDLRKVQTMSALAGVRVSYPMLHPAVVAMSTRVPAELKMQGGRLRDFYKRAMQGFLPNEIITKKKHGFGLPFGLWLRESQPLRELIHANLASLRTRRIVRPEFIDRLLDLHDSDDASHYGVFVWVLASLEQWFQEHRVSPSF